MMPSKLLLPTPQRLVLLWMLQLSCCQAIHQFLYDHEHAFAYAFGLAASSASSASSLLPSSDSQQQQQHQHRRSRSRMRIQTILSDSDHDLLLDYSNRCTSTSTSTSNGCMEDHDYSVSVRSGGDNSIAQLSNICLLPGVAADGPTGAAITGDSNSNQHPSSGRPASLVAPLLSLPNNSDDHQKQQNQQSTTTTTAAAIQTTLRSTGTTICGLALRDGTVILGADTRATDDRMVADKYCSKIHALLLLENDGSLYACGAGTSGDLEAVTRQVRFEMMLQQLQQGSIGNTGDAVTTTSTTASSSSSSLTQQVIFLLKNKLYQAGGSLGVNLIIGGEGSLVALHPHGSMEQVPFAALGSGGLAAMGILEDSYSPDLTLKKAKTLVMRAIQAGIDNDLGSGSQVDLCIMRKGRAAEYIRAAAPAEVLPVPRSVKDSNRTSTLSGGVNGFGNLPYQEQSRRTIMLPDSGDDAAAVPSNWDAVLGLV